MNRYPAWKYLLVVVVILFGIIYSLPNLYKKDFAVQVSADSSHTLDDNTLNAVHTALANQQIQYSQVEKVTSDSVMYHFANADVQLRADDVIKDTLGEGYTVALNLATTTPKWLQSIGAVPVHLGLDLSGGVHFLMAIDVNSLITHRMQAAERNISDSLRKNGIR